MTGIFQKAGAIGFALILGFLTTESIAQTPATKQMLDKRNDAAIAADARFWDVFHEGKYEEIQPVLEQLTGLYLRDPTDPVTAGHIGWLHIWRISERARQEKVAPTITDDATLARKYFQEAYGINPSDARLLGFVGVTTLAEARIHQNQVEIAEGNDLLRNAVDAWPEFNLFTAGYMLSTEPADSEKFRQGLAWQWENIDICAGEKISRTNPEFAKYTHLSTNVGPKRVCWNSFIAPHNMEGFFLNMGDMVVKSGDWKLAQKVYGLAKTSPDYVKWKYAPVLEERISNAQSNVGLFVTNKGLMINAKYSCMACHQN